MLRFTSPRPVFRDGQLKYNPTDEWMFPSVVSTSCLGGRPLGRWYMYYSPHDAPGGICLAYADDLLGEWTEYDGNPIISRDWPPHYRVSHVASPHALWAPHRGRLLLWFHGENEATRWASSDDGIHFRYEGVALTTAELERSTGCSYARVFPHRMPSTDSAYVMLLMGVVEGRCVLHLAWSADARTWTARSDPFIEVPQELSGHGGSPWLLQDDGRYYVVYHNAFFLGDPEDYNIDGDFCAVPVTADLQPCGPHRVLHPASQGDPDDKRVADFCLATDEAGNSCVFYCAGRRLHGRIFVMPVTRAARA